MTKKNNWGVVLASCSAMAVGNGPINFAFGVFLKPVSADLGVSRGVFSGAMGLTLFITALVSPFFGTTVDRFGYRKCLLMAVPFFSIGLAGLAFLPSSRLGIYALFAITGALAVGQTPAAYSKAISVWSDERRGLALGIAIAGVGLGTILIPQYAGLLIRHFSWHISFIGLAVAVIVFAFFPVLIWLKELPKSGLGQDAMVVQNATVGFTRTQALRAKVFWAISIAFFLAGMVISGTLSHLVAMLTDRGFTIETATSALSMAGIAIIIGRLASGYALDRVHAPYVALAFFIFPMLGIVLFVFGNSTGTALLGTILLGLAIGADIDLVPFLIGRYFGLRHFGQVYGLVFSIFLIGNGLGTAVLGYAFDLTGSYKEILLCFEPILAVACLFMLKLGPYTFPVRQTTLPTILRPQVQLSEAGN